MRKDITGQRFGYLTAIRNTGEIQYRKSGVSNGFIWEFRCDCGNLCYAPLVLVSGGHKKSCGCKHYEMVSEKLKKDNLEGQKFGKLTVIKWLPIEEREQRYRYYQWLCKCDCGNYAQARGKDLQSGNKISCGCVHDKYSKSYKITNLKHGLSQTRLYNVWMMIKDRCTNENSKSYKRYGGRGITLCQEWFDFDTFREWALKTGYDETAERCKCTIERIDNNKGYFPENCIWADAKTQRRNQECTKKYEYNGKYMIVTDWAKELGVSFHRLHYALYYKGMTIYEFLEKEKIKSAKKQRKEEE